MAAAWAPVPLPPGTLTILVDRADPAAWGRDQALQLIRYHGRVEDRLHTPGGLLIETTRYTTTRYFPYAPTFLPDGTIALDGVPLATAVAKMPYVQHGAVGQAFAPPPPQEFGIHHGPGPVVLQGEGDLPPAEVGGQVDQIEAAEPAVEGEGGEEAFDPEDIEEDPEMLSEEEEEEDEEWFMADPMEVMTSSYPPDYSSSDEGEPAVTSRSNVGGGGDGER